MWIFASWWLNQPHLKNIRQIGNLSPGIGVKIKNIWNHHLVWGWELLKHILQKSYRFAFPFQFIGNGFIPKTLPLEMKYRVYEDYICIRWALPKGCNSGLWRLIIWFPSLKKMNGYFSHCYRVWATPPICSYLPSKWQGSFFKTNLKPFPPPKKKTWNHVTCKNGPSQKEICASFKPLSWEIQDFCLHASGASVQIFQGPLAGIFLQRWLDQVQPLLRE